MKAQKLILIFPIILLSGCNKKVITREQYDSMYDHLCEMWEKTLSAHDYDYAFFGDSRVAGGSFSLEFSSYNVVNLGIGGDKVSNCIRRYNLIEAAKPETVFLAVGGNDALSSEFSKDTFISEYNQLLNKFKNSGINVIMHTIPGLTVSSSIAEKDVKKGNEKIAVANEEIKKIANEFSYTLIDLQALMCKEDGRLKDDYSADGCHFTYSGYQVWYGEIMKIIAK